MSRRFGWWSFCLILLPLAALSGAALREAVAQGTPEPRMVLGGGVAVVKPGETIYDVSRRTNTPVRELIDANHLSPPYRLTPGATLTVPKQRHHIVKPGETLNSIAEMEGVEIYSLARMNELTRPFAVKPGQTLTLPPGAAGVQASAPPPGAAPNSRETPPPPAPPGPPGAKPSTVQRPLASGQDTPAPPPEKPAPGGAEAQNPPPPPNKPVQQFASTPPANAPAAPQESPLPTPPPRGGNFLWPVKGKIVGRYGTSASGAHNDGINIAAPKGTPVQAADAGVVAYAGNELRGYGNLILVKHSGGYMTAYAHNEALLVKRGDTVKRGQEIARVGSSGIVSSPQLHFEIRQGTKVLDPDLYLPGG